MSFTTLPSTTSSFLKMTRTSMSSQGICISSIFHLKEFPSRNSTMSPKMIKNFMIVSLTSQISFDWGGEWSSLRKILWWYVSTRYFNKHSRKQINFFFQEMNPKQKLRLERAVANFRWTTVSIETELIHHSRWGIFLEVFPEWWNSQLDEVVSKSYVYAYFFHTYLCKRLCTPLKTNMSPENRWLEDVRPTEIVPF